MADVQVGDLLEVTSGPRNGEKYWVRGLIDDRGEVGRMQSPSWLDSEVTVHRRSESVNSFGQTDAGLSQNATGVKCSFQRPRADISARGWGSEKSENPRAYFDDKTFEVELTEEESLI